MNVTKLWLVISSFKATNKSPNYFKLIGTRFKKINLFLASFALPYQQLDRCYAPDPNQIFNILNGIFFVPQCPI